MNENRDSNRKVSRSAVILTLLMAAFVFLANTDDVASIMKQISNVKSAGLFGIAILSFVVSFLWVFLLGKQLFYLETHKGAFGALITLLLLVPLLTGIAVTHGIGANDYTYGLSRSFRDIIFFGVVLGFPALVYWKWRSDNRIKTGQPKSPSK
jgi:choline-glycine betaine transporter